MNKIKKLIAKFAKFTKDFSLLGFLLTRKESRILKSIDLKDGLIKSKESLVDLYKDFIEVAIIEIDDLKSEIITLENKMNDIKKIK